MALTIITGTPGAGKTALVVSMLKELVDKATPENPMRRVYVMGIQDLLLPHEPTPPLAQWTEMRPAPEDPSLMVPTYTFEPGSLIIIAEAQLIFRNRAPGSAVPDHVSAMERHRHLGLDFWIDTQGTALVDPNIRRLCNPHIHLRAMWFGRRLYEWSEVTDTESRLNRESAASRKYKLPKQVFGLYKSAQIHTKQPRRIPVWAFVIAFAIVAVPALGWRLYQSINSRFEPAEASVSATTSWELGQPVPTGVGSRPAPAAPVGVTVAEFEPRLAGRPETAPLYDVIREVKAMPVVAGCVASRTRCSCYSEQGTDVGLTGEQCRAWLENPPFNPYREPVQIAAATAATSEPK